MHIHRAIVAAVLLGFLVFGGCVLISTLAINQFRKDRAFMLQHCTLSR